MKIKVETDVALSVDGGFSYIWLQDADEGDHESFTWDDLYQATVEDNTKEELGHIASELFRFAERVRLAAFNY